MFRRVTSGTLAVGLFFLHDLLPSVVAPFDTVVACTSSTVACVIILIVSTVLVVILLVAFSVAINFSAAATPVRHLSRLTLSIDTITATFYVASMAAVASAATVVGLGNIVFHFSLYNIWSKILNASCRPYSSQSLVLKSGPVQRFWTAKILPLNMTILINTQN